MSSPVHLSAPVRLSASVRFRLYQRPEGNFAIVVDTHTGQKWVANSLESARQIQAQLERWFVVKN
jgi:hypothetical protein